MNIVCKYNNTVINHAVLADGTVRAVKANDIVPERTLMEVFELKWKGSSDADIIDVFDHVQFPQDTLITLGYLFDHLYCYVSYNEQGKQKQWWKSYVQFYHSCSTVTMLQNGKSWVSPSDLTSTFLKLTLSLACHFMKGKMRHTYSRYA